DAFTLTGACDDAMLASNHLAGVSGSAPAFVMGVRAGCMVAIETAARTDASGGLVLWQPIQDWEAYLHEIEAMDARQRAAIPGAGPPSKDALMGFALSPQLRARPPGLATRPADGSRGRTIVVGDHATASENDATTI